MKAAYYLGWGLAVLSFVSGGAELIAASVLDGQTITLGMRDTWYTLWPASFVHAGVWFKAQGLEWLWRDLLLMIMVLPAWLLLGLPAALLIIFCRPPKADHDEDETNLLEVYQTLSEQARADETFDPREDDMAPTHFEPDPQGFEPSDHLAGRQDGMPERNDDPDPNNWGDISWADKDDERFVHMQIEDDTLELGTDQRVPDSKKTRGR